ncbi:MAG: hypothetical protein JNK72_24975 [Myxococcales bacterium]|nr:hypothetical protein [Myxococcales bacterium]
MPKRNDFANPFVNPFRAGLEDLRPLGSRRRPETLPTNWTAEALGMNSRHMIPSRRNGFESAALSMLQVAHEVRTTLGPVAIDLIESVNVMEREHGDTLRNMMRALGPHVADFVKMAQDFCNIFGPAYLRVAPRLDEAFRIAERLVGPYCNLPPEELNRVECRIMYRAMYAKEQAELEAFTRESVKLPTRYWPYVAQALLEGGWRKAAKPIQYIRSVAYRIEWSVRQGDSAFVGGRGARLTLLDESTPDGMDPSSDEGFDRVELYHDVTNLLDAARLSPSGRLVEPYLFIVDDREDLAHLSGLPPKTVDAGMRDIQRKLQKRRGSMR